MENIKFKDYLQEQLKDPKFKDEWDLLEKEYKNIVGSVENQDG